MITDHPATIDAATLSGIAEFVWQTFVGDDLVCVDETAPPAEPIGAGGYYSSISIGGEWNATLVAALSAPLARTYSAALLGMEPDELEIADIDDAVGELANIVGGNVKGLVPDQGAATLSLPVVSHDVPTIAGGQLTVECRFLAGGEPLVWTLYERP